MPRRELPSPWILLRTALVVLPAVAFVVLHARSPFDGARMNATQDPWRAEGIVLSPVGPGTILPGDVLVAIDGTSLETWARRLLDFRQPRPSWSVGDRLRYTVLRNGSLLDVDVTLRPYPLATLIGSQWGLYVTLLLYLAVMAFLYLRRPGEPATRALLLVSAGLSSVLAWGLGLTALDFVGAWGFWFHQVASLAVYLLIWVAFAHVVLVFPRKQAFLARRPWIIRALYAVPFLLYAAYLVPTAALSRSVLDWIGRINAFPIWIALGYATLGGIFAVRGVRELRDPTHRLQARWILFAAILISATDLALGILPELIRGRPLVPWDTLSLFGLIVPLALLFAVLRYRLFDIDLIINRTLVYLPLTAILAGGYAASIKLFQVFFVAATGNESDGAVILTTLILVGAFTPVKDGLQARVDRSFATPHEPALRLRAFDQQVQQMIEALDPVQSLRRLLDLAVEAYGAEGGAITLAGNGRPAIVYRTEKWDGEVSLRVPLKWQGASLGVLKLGPPRQGPARPTLDPGEIEGCAGRVAHLARLVDDSAVFGPRPPGPRRRARRRVPRR